MSDILAKAELIQEVAELYMKGQKESDIARVKGISKATVSKYITEWEQFIRDNAIKNPELFDRVLENSLKFIENYDMMLKNAWEVHDEAKEAEVAATRLSSLKLIQEITAQKARFYQLLGPRQDMNYMEKAKRAERVNEMLSDILRNTVSDCERCNPLVWDRLQEVWTMMNRGGGEEEYPELIESSE